jgi:hypothetical protein
LITEEIVDEVTSSGRFLRFDKGREKWMVMDREAARIKVAQALQYRHRRVAKGLESMDDSLEPNPLPLSHPGQQAVPQHIFPPLPAQAASMFNQDGLLGLLQHSDRSHPQQQHGEWGAIRRQPHQQQQQQQCVLPQLHVSQQDHQRHRQQQSSLDLDHDSSSSIHAAAVHRQLQQQQRDQQRLSDQLDDLIGQRQLANLRGNPSTGHLAGAGAAAAAGPLYNVAGGPLYAAGLGHLEPIDLHHHRDSDRNVHAASTVSQEQHHQPLLAQLSLAALEPRPVVFRSNDATVTGVPSGFGSHHTTSTLAARRTDHPSFRPVRSSSGGNHQGHNPWPASPGQHQRPQGAATAHPHRSRPSAATAAAGVAVAVAHHQREEEDSDDAASLADLLTDDVEDDPSAVDGHEPEDTHSLSWQDDPSFGDRHGS